MNSKSSSVLRSPLFEKIFKRIQTESACVICITGASGVGKSTFVTELVKQAAALYGVESTVISSDHFLRKELRGSISFRNNYDGPLTPAFFDFEAISAAVGALLSGNTVTIDGYERGHGWRSSALTLRPSKSVVCEGLFLDSIDAVSMLPCDTLIKLTAPQKVIAERKRRREILGGGKMPSGRRRTTTDVEREIDSTQKAYESYAKVAQPNCTTIELQIDERGDWKPMIL